MQLPPGKLIHVNVMSRDIDEFATYAKMVLPLKQFGQVIMTVHTLMKPRPLDLPDGHNAWHEYLTMLPTLTCFFPHPRLQPYLDMDYVRLNQQALAQRVAVLSEHGLGAHITPIIPSFWPEAFFRDNPHLRGPRVDHPRRSRKEEFSPCTDQPEVQDMYRWMMAEMRRHIPMLKTMHWRFNDVGSGFCWSNWLYPGVTGPSHCSHIDTGERIARMFHVLQEGAREGGGEIRISADGCLGGNEGLRIVTGLGPNMFLQGYKDPSVGLYGKAADPVQGLIRPSRIIASAARGADESIDRLAINFVGSYQQCDKDDQQDMKRVLDLVGACLGDLPPKSLREQNDRLFDLCRQWAGQDHADAAFEAFDAMEKAEAFPVAPYRTHYWINLRYVNRPLVIRPDLLTAQEESYFLPYVFNPSRSEARLDYADSHGVRIRQAQYVRQAIAMQIAAAKKFEALAAAPQGEWFKRLAMALRLRASIFRSCDNFNRAQQFREKYHAQLHAEPHVPDKQATNTGEEGNLEWNSIQLDELENAETLLGLLQGGGLEQISRSAPGQEENMFRLPNDLVASVKKKIDVMRKHWRDVEQYMAPPLK